MLPALGSGSGARAANSLPGRGCAGGTGDAEGAGGMCVCVLQ